MFQQRDCSIFFFGVLLGELILCHSDNLSRTLQASHISAAEGQKIATMTVKTLQSIRNERCFGVKPLQVLMKLMLVNLYYLVEEKPQSGMR